MKGRTSPLCTQGIWKNLALIIWIFIKQTNEHELKSTPKTYLSFLAKPLDKTCYQLSRGSALIQRIIQRNSSSQQGSPLSLLPALLLFSLPILGDPSWILLSQFLWMWKDCQLYLVTKRISNGSWGERGTVVQQRISRRELYSQCGNGCKATTVDSYDTLAFEMNKLVTTGTFSDFLTRIYIISKMILL